jgi:hypothetical protein
MQWIKKLNQLNVKKQGIMVVNDKMSGTEGIR